MSNSGLVFSSAQFLKAGRERSILWFSVRFREDATNGKHVPLTEERKMDPSHEPYYVINFEHIVRCVIDHSDDRRLFNESDMAVVGSYRDMCLDARKLYVRMFDRKIGWKMRKDVLKYKEIHDGDAALKDLLAKGLFRDGEYVDDLKS